MPSCTAGGVLCSDSVGFFSRIKPTYVVVESGTKTTADTIAVMPIYPDQEYVTTLSTAGTLAIGTKYTIATDSAQITATSTNGVATVLETTGSASGSEVVVKFE